ncbi:MULTISPECIES: anti-CBASS protein Acb1 family protein [Commensalibacter]|uniref:anti-CBASS protein Acb1 family protein n=1 Tax=Commensalibacter TaxID=1079922 RepID=UPI0012D95BE7|nr:MULTISPECIES: anti-CBASS Acb1 family protein [Commensalibacter]MBI0083573.1 DUF1073 domain-containing protein [Commensalibacter sp. W6292M3]MBI0088832.1 DUF1073 domain-containing protein [Commensalibacter melissae]MUG09418.1 DUF1073 domain-containing protein [Commensalibacter melissae]
MSNDNFGNSGYNNSGLYSKLLDRFDEDTDKAQFFDANYLSYGLCKSIYMYHPLGKRIIDLPIDLSIGQERIISVKHETKSDELIEQFIKVWNGYGFKNIIRRLATMSRLCGISALFLKVDGYNDHEPLPVNTNWADLKITPIVYDAMNIAGSASNNQDLMSENFLKVEDVLRSGMALAKDRSFILSNGDPLYNEFSTSAFGFTGRSVYQNCIHLLKAWLYVNNADAMVAKKCGLIIAKENDVGTATELTSRSLGIKRELLRAGSTNDVLSVGASTTIESLNLQNIDGSLDMARNHILEDIANASDIPTIILGQQRFTQGFGEGSEDTKHVGRFIESIREWERGAYQFIDNFVMRMAWNFDYLKALNKENGDIFKSKNDEEITIEQYWQVFYSLKQSFSYSFPSFLTESESQIAEGDQKKLEMIVDVYDRVFPKVEADMQATLTNWLIDSVNNLRSLNKIKLNVDEDDLRQSIVDNYLYKESEEPKEEKDVAI